MFYFVWHVADEVPDVPNPFGSGTPAQNPQQASPANNSTPSSGSGGQSSSNATDASSVTGSTTAAAAGPSIITEAPTAMIPLCELPPLLPGFENKACLDTATWFTYDKSTGQCIRFIYGGCGKSANLFPTEDECRRACVRRSELWRTIDILLWAYQKRKKKTLQHFANQWQRLRWDGFLLSLSSVFDSNAWTDSYIYLSEHSRLCTNWGGWLPNFSLAITIKLNSSE